MQLKDRWRRPALVTLRLWSRAALLWLCATALFAQPPTTIRVPVRLVSVPTLVLGADGRALTNLQAADFRLFDDDRQRPFTLDTTVSPVSVVIAVQANPDIRAYLPFIAKVGNALDALLVGESGESAAIVYGDEVTVAKPFDTGDLSSTLRKLESGGRHARAIDAGVRALALLRQRPATRNRVLIFIGQPADHGSEYRLEDLRREAERDSVTIHALALPEIGKAFISDTFSLRGLSSRTERGGFKAGVDLTRLLPVLTGAAAVATDADPFSVLTSATGGTLLHFRKQNQLEDAIAIVGVELRSSYTLSFTPSPATSGYHTIRVETPVAGAKTHARPGYWLSTN
jgi:VWFA-related protein